MGFIKSYRINNSGNVALELVVSLVLTASFLIPSADTVYQVYRNRNEAIGALNTISRAFQISPESAIRTNLEALRIQLQRKSNRNLSIYLSYKTVDGILESLNVDVYINSDLPFTNRLHFSDQIRRLSFAS